jgi:hypothetical protein
VAATRRKSDRAAAVDNCRPRVRPSTTQNSGPTGSSIRSSSHGCSSSQVHADLATSSALSATDKQRTAPLIEVGPGEGERFLDAQPGARG